MWVYWLLFVFAAVGALIPRRLPQREARWLWGALTLGFALVIGLRFEVGGDWFTYLSHFDFAARSSFRSILFESKDPGYYLISWIISKFGGEIFLLNAFCASVLMIGTVRLAREQPWPWIALLVAIPYLLIVVGMGYTRQSAAIGLVMLGLVSLGNGSVRWFVFWVLVGATFHKSATLLLPIAGLAATRNRRWTLFWVGVVSLLGAWLLVLESSTSLWSAYVESEYAHASQGGPVRVAMNALPAVLLLLFRKRLPMNTEERRLWSWIAVASLVCIPLLLVSATAVDRIALYFIPLQLFVFSRLPQVANTTQLRTLIVLAIIVYYALVQFVWLNFAGNSGAWLPYRFMPL